MTTITEKDRIGKKPSVKHHQAANIFPMLGKAELQELADDIKTNGLRLPIELCGGKIIDGRNRLKACDIAGIEPDYCDIETDDPVAYVLSMNLHRRHLDTGQRAMVGAKLKVELAKQAKQRQRDAGKTHGKGQSKVVPNSAQANGDGKARDEAAKAVNVGHTSIDAAATVLDKGSPALVKAVEDGEVAVSAAAKLTELPKSLQTKVVKGGKDAVRAATAKPKLTPPPSKYAISESFTNTLGLYVGTLLSFERDYGPIKEMVANKKWNPKHTKQAYVTLDGIIKDLTQARKEFKECLEGQQ